MTAWAKSALAGHVAVQGNLDPHALIAGGAALDSAVDNILREMRGSRFIFNLGHGILPTTPVDHVAATIDMIHKLSQR